MGDYRALDHLPDRLAVVSWDAPRAVPDVVRSLDQMPLREGEVEYIRADILRGAVAAERERWLRWAVRRACCEAGLIAAPDPCSWHDEPLAGR
jgi:hypothetical protein